MAKLQEIDITLTGLVRSRLELKQYDKAYTDVPNVKLPAALIQGLSEVYKELTGEEFPTTDNTFTVACVQDVNGDYSFNALYAPTVFRTDAEEPTVFIQWGSVKINLTVENGTIESPTGMSLKVRNRKIGKYDTPCLIATTKNYVMPFPIRTTDFNTTADTLDILLDGDEVAFIDEIMVKKSGGGGSKFNGYTVKAGQLPVGEYTIVGFRLYDHPKFGRRYYLHALTPSEPFDATISYKDEDSLWWLTKTVAIDEDFQIQSNSAIVRYMDSNPIINDENPATLIVYEKGEFNGHQTSSVVMKISAFAEDPDALDLDF